MRERSSRRVAATITVVVSALSACTPRPVDERPETPKPAKSSPAPARIPMLTLDSYKKDFASRIARASADMYTEPVPEILKSIVVLDIAIDRDGNLRHVAVRRSNGFRALEHRAMDNVRRAAPFAAPPFTIRRADGSVSFLETFLFRDDGRFRILSLQT
jgi:TonB family protein